jgi:hypothetical protein
MLETPSTSKSGVVSYGTEQSKIFGSTLDDVKIYRCGQSAGKFI